MGHAEQRRRGSAVALKPREGETLPPSQLDPEAARSPRTGAEGGPLRRDPVQVTAPPISSPEEPISDALDALASDAKAQTDHAVPLWDLALVAVLALAAAAGSSVLPGGSWPRLALAGLVVFVLPGYALLEAALPRRLDASGASTPRAREGTWRLLAALGLSPALTGLAALATALVPGGFRAGPIILAVTLMVLVFTAAAGIRRSHAAGTGGLAARATMPAMPAASGADSSNPAPER